MRNGETEEEGVTVEKGETEEEGGDRRGRGRQWRKGETEQTM